MKTVRGSTREVALSDSTAIRGNSTSQAICLNWDYKTAIWTHRIGDKARRAYWSLLEKTQSKPFPNFVGTLRSHSECRQGCAAVIDFRPDEPNIVTRFNTPEELQTYLDSDSHSIMKGNSVFGKYLYVLKTSPAAHRDTRQSPSHSSFFLCHSFRWRSPAAQHAAVPPWSES